MVSKEDIIEDTYDDSTFKLLSKLNKLTTWTFDKKALKDSLLRHLEGEKYVFFSATNPNRYHIQSIGQHYLYDVPLYKQGVLKEFRGKRVRIICTHSGSHTWRGFMAGAVYATPADKIIEKVVKHYRFPNKFDSHKILYKSPRFKVIKLETDDEIRRAMRTGDTESVDLHSWDGLVLDGKHAAPIVLIRMLPNSGCYAQRITHMKGYEFGSIREAIDYYQSDIN